LVVTSREPPVWGIRCGRCAELSASNGRARFRTAPRIARMSPMPVAEEPPRTGSVAAASFL
jgi:hypothetical protein